MFSGKLASSNAVSTQELKAGNHYILNTASGNYKSIVWIIDSGATRHICNDEKLFINTKKVFNTRVKLPNQMLIQVHLVGNLQLNNHLILKNVLYVPQVELNLNSVTSLTEDKNVMVALYHDYALIQRMNNKMMMGKGSVKEGLYLLDQELQTSSINTISLQQ